MADDFADWGLNVENPGQWVRFARCAEASVYVNTANGSVATISAWDLKSGRLRLRELAGDVLEFFAEYAIGPRYPTILEDPAAQRLLPASEDDWIRFLLSIGVIDESTLGNLEARWAEEYVDPASQIPATWSDTPQNEAERTVHQKLTRLRDIGFDVFASSGVANEWNLDHIGFDPGRGARMRLIPDATEPLWRLQRMVGTAGLGTLYLYTEELIIDHTKALPRRFTSLGIDDVQARQWFAIGEYHRKAKLLLHRETGEVAGLEPAPSNRLRHLHPDPIGFVNEYGLSPRHTELRYSPRSRPQSKAAHQWVDFLHACEVIT
ncbi:hypothetical protein [Actinomadura sp. 7K507]|uniref:hypothetical protein n=1 Tax=Actinomadura sp. 7K507 TaxID=2530365 RepID=UPI00104C8A69|nr:hypothetical protein [Actinomadura sp. 7K507]TDC74134.1 hypothetical protein E1285_43745 [Actinomadura sp. 7K507]